MLMVICCFHIVAGSLASSSASARSTEKGSLIRFSVKLSRVSPMPCQSLRHLCAFDKSGDDLGCAATWENAAHSAEQLEAVRKCLMQL